jgi:hypothetical protein
MVTRIQMQSSLKARWSLGYVSAIDSNGRTIWIADAHRDDGKRFVVYADGSFRHFVGESSSSECSSINLRVFQI